MQTRKQIAVAFLLSCLTLTMPASANDFQSAAEAAARWVTNAAITRDGGLVWPADPRDPKSVGNSLYAGSPGPILFLLEAYRHIGNREYLQTARAGADALLVALPKETENGFYVGIAGIGFTLGQTYLVTKEQKYRDGVLATLKLLQERAKKEGRGVAWNDTNDIIAGSAGTGLFLLWAAREFKLSAARELAVQAARRLIERGQSRGDGKLGWMLDSKYPRELPNFSHGTAGVAYFFATLYQETKQKEFLDAALAGAKYLTSIADVEGDACVIYHNDANKKLYYLSWCHGPAGTSRLFYRLYQITNDASWMQWVNRLARGTLSHGAPEHVVTPGEWNNISACCGVTGQAAFFLSMYELTKENRSREFAVNASKMLLTKSMQDEAGTRWIQAEHRVRPELLVAQTGLMQGASGVGLWLLHLSAFEGKKKVAPIMFPDNPFKF